MQVMQSNKWTFSLASLVVLLALGFAVAPVTAHKAEKGQSHLVVDFQLDTSIIDVSSHDNNDPGIEQDIQIDSGRIRHYAVDATATPPVGYPRAFRPRVSGANPNVALSDGEANAEPILTFLVEFDKGVPLTHFVAGDDPRTPDVDESTDKGVLGPDGTTRGYYLYPGVAGFGLDDIVVEVFDEFGRSWGAVTLKDTTELTIAAGEPQVAKIAFTNPGGTPVLVPGERVGRQFTVEVYYAAFNALKRLLTEARGGDFEMATMIFSFNDHSVTEWATLAYQLALKNSANYVDGKILKDDGTAGVLKDEFAKLAIGPVSSHDIRIDLVDIDEGDPKYRLNDGTLDALESVPGTGNALTGDAVTAGPYIESNSNPGAQTSSNPSGFPNVVSITRLRGTSHDINLPIGYGLANTAAANADIFEVKVVLTEQPDASFLEGNGDALIDVENGAVVGIDTGLPFGNAAEGPTTAREKAAVLPPYMEGGYAVDQTAAGTDPIPEPTGRDNQYWAYRVMIDPDRATNDDVIITVKEFHDQVLPDPKTYKPLTERQRKTAASDSPLLSNRLKQGREILTVPVLKAGAPPEAADPAKSITDARLAHEMALPGGTVIPANGFLVLARGKEAGAGVKNVTADKNDDKGVVNPKLSAAELLYNVKYEVGFPYPGDDLANYFRTGATIQLIYNDILNTGDTGKRKKADGANKKTGYAGFQDATVAAGDVVISEIMWGRNDNAIGKDDAKNPVFSQWIELHNTTNANISIDANEWHLVFGTATSLSSGTVVDKVSNANPYWSAVGQSATQIGNTGSYTDTVSMYRAITATSEVQDGQMQGSWIASTGQPVNALLGTLGTPGAASPAYVKMKMTTTTTTTTTTEEKADPATEADIKITEIMFASDGGRFPQWIELTNTNTGDVSLMGWSVVIENNPDDDDVIGSRLSIDVGDVEVGVDKDGDPQSVLIVSKTSARNSGVGTGKDAKGMLRSERIVDAQSQLSPEAARYSFLSEMGFKISLMPPQTTGVTTYGDIVGNLGEGWDLPMAEGDRSSIIRREMGETGPLMGTVAAGWRLASDTMLDGAYRPTYYGHEDDSGTPGYDAGGALPVELSKFNAARDRLTGQITITWETQSELNNAGFFIKRSQLKNGKFVVVNPTMIAGAGTTAEKQSYTYTDTTAKPHVLYYYQIEDVSLDGQRQTLTRAHRLKGHIGAAGKLTTRWGELKSQE